MDPHEIDRLADDGCPHADPPATSPGAQDDADRRKIEGMLADAAAAQDA